MAERIRGDLREMKEIVEYFTAHPHARARAQTYHLLLTSCRREEFMKGGKTSEQFDKQYAYNIRCALLCVRR